MVGGEIEISDKKERELAQIKIENDLMMQTALITKSAHVLGPIVAELLRSRFIILEDLFEQGREIEHLRTDLNSLKDKMNHV